MLPSLSRELQAGTAAPVPQSVLCVPQEQSSRAAGQREGGSTSENGAVSQHGTGRREWNHPFQSAFHPPLHSLDTCTVKEEEEEKLVLNFTATFSLAFTNTCC